MNMNLVLATGLAYASLGALVLFLSHRAIYDTARRAVAGYPRVSPPSARSATTADSGSRCSRAASSFRRSARTATALPLSLWRYPAAAALAALVLYGILCRVVASRRRATPSARPADQRLDGRGLYETRRSIRLREAARSRPKTATNASSPEARAIAASSTCARTGSATGGATSSASAPMRSRPPCDTPAPW